MTVQTIEPTTDLDQRMAAIEQVLMTGDLAKLSSEQRVIYYNKVCDSLGLNPLTRPFEYATLNSKLTLYARREAAEQLRKIHRVSIRSIEREWRNDLYIVTAEAEMSDGRRDISTGAVNVAGLKGEALANALMKAETKAKRRVTLSICGLGMLDETEVETIAGAVSMRETETRTSRPVVMMPLSAALARDLGAAMSAALAAGWKQSEMQSAMRTRYGAERGRDLSADQARDFIQFLSETIGGIEPASDEAVAETAGEDKE
jgi:hypothetical protein